MFNNLFFPQIVPFMRLFGKNCGRTGHAADDNVLRRMRIACWVTKSTNTHSEYVILIAFPWQ